MLFDFRCPDCNSVFEDLVKPDIRSAQCPECGATAARMVSTPRIDRTRIALTNGASPESIAHFDRIHRERAAYENRMKAEHGDYGKMAGSD
jgi:putative FmdB family regulatory protein